MSEDVYIIGAGIHPFGRTDGRTGREQGVYAVREAMKMRVWNGRILNVPLVGQPRLETPTLWSMN